MQTLVIGHVGTEHVTTPNGVGFSLGGAALYAGIGSLVAGVKTGVVSRVGRDYPMALLAKSGLCLDGITVCDGDSAHFSIAYLPTYEDRQVTLNLGVASTIGINDIPEAYRCASYIHIATNFPDVQLALLRRIRASWPCFISVDCFDAFILEHPTSTKNVLDAVDLFFVNERENELVASLIGDVETPRVIKMSSQGARYCDQERILTVNAPAAVLVDPTGAGDVFAGAYIAGLARRLTLKERMNMACRLASRIVEDFGYNALLPDTFRND